MKNKILEIRQTYTVSILYFMMFFAVSSLCGTAAYAQNAHVSGKVTDAQTGNPLPGVNILVVGTSTGAATDANGHYSIDVPSFQDTLRYSFIGYKTKEVPINGRTTIDIKLKPTIFSGNQLVVIGYGKQQKKDLTSSVDVVNVQDMTKQPEDEVTKLLQGQAAGVTVVGSGQPGDPSRVLIRGINTFQDNSPLYVVDGVPTTSVYELNPNDIASMQVLKGAAAASIYGARASNGVIVITTKKGKGKMHVEYNGYYGMQYTQGRNPWNLLSPIEEAKLKWLAFKNSGKTPSGILYGHGSEPRLPDYIQPEGAMKGAPGTDPSDYFVDPHYTGDEYYDFHRIIKANKSGTDWYHTLFKPAPITNHNLSVSGGGTSGNYLFSLGYLNHVGTLIHTKLKRYSLRANSKYNVSNNIHIGENIGYTFSQNPSADILEGNSSDAPISNAYKIYPIIPVYDIEGNFAGSYGQELGDSDNPVAIMYRQRNNKSLDKHVLGNIFAEIDFLKYFELRTSFGGTVDAGWSHSFSYPTYENSENDQNNSFSASSYNSHEYSWTNRLTFKKDFNNVHSLKVMVGTENHQEKGMSIGGENQAYYSFNPVYLNLSTGSGTQQVYSGRDKVALFSLFGRINYGFKDKYLITGTLRRDGTSKLTNYRYGWFPAVSAGWVISKENFMKNISWIQNLKIRGGWGEMGNERNVSADNAYTLYGGNLSTSYYDIKGTNNSIVQGFQQDRIGNPDAKWERDVSADIGLDADLFHNDISLTVDVYKKTIKGLLYDPDLPGLAGTASAPYVNIARMRDKGIDGTLTGRVLISSNLRFVGTLTYTSYNNKILKISNTANYFSEDHIRNEVGHPISSFFGYKIAGFFNSEEEIKKYDAMAAKVTGDQDAQYEEAEGVGRFRYADLNHDGQIDPGDRTFLGNPNPKFTAGLNLHLYYKNFDFSAFLYERYGNDLWNAVRSETDFFNHKTADSKIALYDSWSPDNHNAIAPIPLYVSHFSTNGASSSYFVENGSYLRLKNVEIGYSLPAFVLSRIGLRKLRIYLKGANLFTATKYSGIDPEIAGGVTEFGIDDGTYPSPKEWIIGINLKF
jgi:TonB-linked SusC/RagA family outer membrane protein